MTRFVLRRLAVAIPIALGIIFFCFLGLEMSENSRARRPSYDVPGYAALAWRDSTGFLSQAARGDLGTVAQGRGRSRQNVPVARILLDTYPKSLALLALALGIAAGAGILFGFFTALKERSPVGMAAMTVTLLGISTPTFFAALLLQVAEIAFYNKAGFRLVPVAGFGWDSHLILPTLVLAARPLAHIARVTLVSVREVLDQDYMRTGLAKGLPDLTLWGHHALHNAAIPVLTGVSVSLRFSLSSLPVVEYFFDWPGMGAALLDGIRQGQAYLVVTLALALGLTFIVLDLLLDVAYRILDPRLTKQEAA